MPELPEVETVRTQLHGRLKGCVIKELEIWKRGREFSSPAKLTSAVIGQTIVGVERRAKLLIWRFADGSAMTAHLKMTGRFTFVDAGYERAKHDRILFVCENGFGERVHVVWSDVRQFGFVRAVTPSELLEVLSEYGPEPLDTSAETLAEVLPVRSSRSIKAVLLDQAVLAGVGNIYADEACFKAAILPQRLASSLTDHDRVRLMKAVKEILVASVKQRGTSANDYLDAEGKKGGFLALLKVYGRAKEPCVTCTTPIEKIVLGQRGTHFCPTCQK